jgi:hypothetical protein
MSAIVMPPQCNVREAGFSIAIACNVFMRREPDSFLANPLSQCGCLAKPNFKAGGD